MTIQASISPENDSLVAECKLIGRRQIPNQAEPQLTTHFTARVRLTQRQPVVQSAPLPGAPAGFVIKAPDIYRYYFHGPAYQVLEQAWRDGDLVVGQMPRTLPGHHFPAERPLLMAPRLIELCFQTAGLWEMGVQGHMGLPRHIQQVSLCRVPVPAADRLYALVTPHPDQESFDAEVVDSAGNKYVQLSGYGTVALPDAVDAEPLKALQAVAV